MAEPEPVQKSDSVPRRWFGRGRNRVRVPDWSPDVLSRARAGLAADEESRARAQPFDFDMLLVSKDRYEPSDPREPLQLEQTPTVAPKDGGMADLRLIVERGDSTFGLQALRWQDSDDDGEPFGVRESALDALGRLRIRMDEVVYLVPIAADHGFKAVSVTPIGLHLLVADLDTGDLLSELRHDPSEASSSNARPPRDLEGA